jgi:hypothetical protein
MSKYYITKGFIKSPKSNKETFVGLQSLDKIFKDLFSVFKVTHADPCCVADPTSRPTKFNKTLNQLQYLDVDNTTWVAVP